MLRSTPTSQQPSGQEPQLVPVQRHDQVKGSRVPREGPDTQRPQAQADPEQHLDAAHDPAPNPILGHLLSEMQILARSHPGASW